MKITKTIIAASVVAAAGYAGVASAHLYTFALGTANSAITRTDKFGLACAGGSTKITYQVKDVKTPTEKTTVIKIRAATTAAGLASATWYPANQLGAYTAEKTISNGPSTYYFEINKSTAALPVSNNGTETYVAQMHCKDVNNVHNPDDQSPTPDVWLLRNK